MSVQENSIKRTDVNTRANTGKQYESIRLFTKYVQMILVYIFYVRNANVANGRQKKEWVNYLINLMPLDAIKIITRENGPEVNYYHYLKRIHLKRYKLSSE